MASVLLRSLGSGRSLAARVPSACRHSVSSRAFNSLSTSGSSWSLVRPRLARTFAAAAPTPLLLQSEPHGNAVASGAPDWFLQKKVRIFKPSRGATQQGVGGRKWRLEYPADERMHKNPLMGWTGTGDTAHQLHGKVTFDTKEEAINYVEAQGFAYEVEEPKTKKKQVKSYSYNYDVKKYGLKLDKK